MACHASFIHIHEAGKHLKFAPVVEIQSANCKYSGGKKLC